MPQKNGLRSLWGGLISSFNKINKGNRRGFTITEVLIALGVVAVIAVLILPVITTRAQNKSFALSYETEVKQMLNSLEGLPISENKNDIAGTMMFVENDDGNYANNAGAYINKYMKVAKYCGNEPGDCFGGEYYEYKDNDRVTFDIKDVKGACALLKNGVSICLKPQVKKTGDAEEEIQGWIDLNGPKGPNIYGRDLRTFAINLKRRAVFTEEEPTTVIVPDPPAPCEGENCGEIEKDPCKVNPRGEECCKREGFVASGTEDICCPWYRNVSGPNHTICYPKATECDPTVDPTCKINECTNKAISGPGDECCAVLEAQGKHDPNCCAPNDTSDYCCSVHPETEGCCKKNIDSGKLKLTADSNCCTKYPAIYQEYSACKPACEQNNNSEQCCNTVSRRNEIRDPDDACCMYEAVNGIDAQGYNNAYNKYCCRLPKNASEQCCKWKYDHIGTSLDYYAKHNYNNNDGTFDDCCHGDVRGIKYAKGKTDSKSQEVLKRCCTVNKAQSNAEEDEACCDYLVSQLGNGTLVHGQALRRCCKYANHKNKAQCCSHDHDGLASQTYNANVPYASQCCMPNTIYNNNVTPHINCCFDVPNAVGESNAFWNNKRWDGCCSYGDNTYNGHKANTQGQWQKNCCKTTRAKYPSDATYNAACCTASASAKSANRDSWQYFSATKNECCETLDRQFGNRDEHWQSHCCYGFKGGNLSTNNPYYETEQKCCKISGNWTEGCCTKSGLDTNDDKWKKNCCSLPKQYTNNVEYRKYCCFDATTRTTAKNTDNDYTRNSDNADNPNGKNAANVNNGNNKQYCCDPDMANVYTTENSGQTFKWSAEHTPNKACCEYFQSRGWKDNDNAPLSKYYKAACCQAHHVYDEENFTCEEKWMCGSFASYGIPGGVEGTCCESDYTYQKKDVTTPNVWRPGCCDFPTRYTTNEIYRGACCEANTTDYTRKGKGNTSNNKQYCCHWNATDPNVECCKLFRSKQASTDAWQDWDGKQPDAEYKRKCCEKSTTATGNTNYCPDSCAIRWLTSESKGSVNYDYTRCCSDRANQTHTDGVKYKKKTIWQNNCCSYVGDAPKGTNGYESYTDYRKGCCQSDRVNKPNANIKPVNVTYCCDPTLTSNPNASCCDDFRNRATNKSGDANQDWKDYDDVALSEAYKIACCRDRDKCYDSCPIRWKTGLAVSDVKTNFATTGNNARYDFTNCCKRMANQSGYSTYGKTSTFWKTNCCRYAGIRTSDGYASYADYRSGCCKPNTEQTFKDTNDGAGQNNINCCIPNAVSVNTATGAVSGIAPTKACCEAFKAYDTAKTGAWKSHDGETINDAYKTACCKLHGVCPDGADACKIRSNTWNNAMYNLPTCCKDSTMQTQHYKDSDQVWRKACCDGSITGGTSSLNTLNLSDYRTYCCSSAGTSESTLKSGSEDKRCCVSADGNTKLRSQKCCTNVPSGRTDLSNIGYHCDCTTAANTWQVVNTNYQVSCCTHSDVMTDASKSITKDATTRADWQSKCCTQSIVHTSPANNTIRDRHYTYCCNNGGAYSDKSKWLNSTCCKVASSSSSSKSTEGVDWNGVTTVSACCYYLESYPTETCCNAKMSSAGWNNTTSTRDTGYKKSCCDQVNNDKYCSCGSKLDKNMATSDACCNAMKTTDNGKARWQADCCKYRTSYPSNAAYRSSTAGCCSGDGANNTTKNPTSQNDVKYCCNPDASAPTAACCSAFKANSNWTNWDGGKLSDAYRVYCCKQHNICDGNPTPDEDCRIRSLTNTPARYNLPTCCNKGGMQASHMDDGTWQSYCCDGQTNPSGTSSRNSLTKAQYQQYCCSGSSENNKYTYENTGTIRKDARCCTKGGNWTTDYCCLNMGTSLKDTHCTCANAATTYNYVKGTGCCTDSTVLSRIASNTATLSDWKGKCCSQSSVMDSKTDTSSQPIRSRYKSYCCPDKNYTYWVQKTCCADYSSANDGVAYPSGADSRCCTFTVANATCCAAYKANGWKNNAGSAPSDAFKIGCCNLSADYCESCAIRAKSNSERWNLPSCCTDSTMQSTNKGTNLWQTNCCDGSTSGSSSRNTLSTADFQTYCCSGTSHATKMSGQSDKRCCTKGGNWTTDYCCLNMGTSLKDTHCTCANAATTYNYVKGTGCCTDSTVLSRTASNTTMKSSFVGTCCKGANPGGVGRDVFRTYCCSNSSTGYVVDGGWNTHCCDGSTSSRTDANNNYCCKNYSNNQCTCSYRLSNSMAMRSPVECCAETKASYTNSHWKSQCCASTNPGGLTRDQFRASCCTNGKNGSATGGGTTTHCCTGSTSDRLSDNDNYCCKNYSNNQCTCAYRLANSMAMRSPVECCAETKASYTNSHWKSQCCASTNPGGLTRDQFRTSCCSSLANGSASGGGTTTHCCDGSTITRDNTDYCCKNYNANQCACTDTKGNAVNGNQFTRCCDNVLGNWSDYCCAQGFDNQCQCANGNGKLNNGHYATRCCTGTSPTTENGSYCCVTGNRDSQCTCNNGNGKLTNGHYATRCCTNTTTPTTENSSYCCVTGNIDGMCTCNNGNGKLTNGNYATRCCTNTTTPTTENSSYCCVTGNIDGMCTCNNGNGKLTNGHYATRCCTGTSPTSENSNYCCVTGNRDSQCTCANGNGKLTNGHYASRCCTGTTPTTENSSYCCKLGSSYNAQCTCANNFGKLTNGNYDSRCCSNSSSDLSDYCCDAGKTNQCSCSKRLSKSMSLNVTIGAGYGSYGSSGQNCCTTLRSSNPSNNYVQTQCCASYINSSWASQCCSNTSVTLSDSNWNTYCCSMDSLNSAPTTTAKQNCCKKIYNNKPSGWGNLFTPDSGCCSILGVSSSTGKDSSGTSYSGCQDPCYNSGTYGSSSGGIYYRSSYGNAKECCDYKYGLASGSAWSGYCCGMRESSDSFTYSITSSNTTCCSKRKTSSGVYYYVPSYASSTCPMGGTAYKCSDYYYSTKGFYCGSSDQCKAWRYQGGSQPGGSSGYGGYSGSSTELSSCCSSIHSWGAMSGTYKTTCCGNDTYRKTSNGQSDCCASEPSDSTLKTKCCSDDASRSYCCSVPSYNTPNDHPEQMTNSCCTYWSNNYESTVKNYVAGASTPWRNGCCPYLKNKWKQECCYESSTYATLNCCSYWGTTKVSGNTSLKSACCSLSNYVKSSAGYDVCCTSSSTSWDCCVGKKNKGLITSLTDPCCSVTGFSNVEPKCACGSTPTSGKLSEDCCKAWQDAGVLSASNQGNACCQNYQGFRYYNYNGTMRYCNSSTTTNICKVTWNISSANYSYSGGSNSITPYVNYSGTYEGYTGAAWIKAKVGVVCNVSPGGSQGSSGEFYVSNNTSGRGNLSSISGSPSGYCSITGCEIYATGSSEGRGVGNSGTKMSTSCSGTINSTWGQYCGKTNTTYTYK